MQNHPPIELPIRTEIEFHAALCALITSAAMNDVSPEGVWSHRCVDEAFSDFDVEISRVVKPVDD